jgi:hypothetical protein
MSRLTDTQLIMLSAASQRDDRAVELPANVKGQAVQKAVDKLIHAGLLEEIRAAGSLPVWRRDDENGPIALRITKQGLEAIDVQDAAVAASTHRALSRPLRHDRVQMRTSSSAAHKRICPKKRDSKNDPWRRWPE